MQKIDSHQHFWHYHPVKDNWITDEMAVIKKDFLPQELMPLLTQNGLDGCIAVQSAQSEFETEFLITLARNNPFIKGVVGWVDLLADDLEERLQHYRQQSIVKGFRHILQAEAGDFMLSKNFQRGLSLLTKHNFTYDILIYSSQIKFAGDLVANHPNQRFVIDHLAKPKIKTQEIGDWKKGIKTIAGYKNVYCKVSGFGTEAEWSTWQPGDVKPYFNMVFDAFGIDRLMYGSDWPVNLLAGGYNKSIDCLIEYTAGLTDADQDKFWGGNAIDFYNL